MKIPRLYTLGEIVYDIICENGNVNSGTPGGAMLNTAVSLGRQTLPVSLISELGRDDLGNMILDFLHDNHIDTQYISRYKGLTSLSFALLDENKNASFQFYKQPPEKSLRQDLPVMHPGDLLLFGSFFSLQDRVFPVLTKYLENCRQNGACICFDPNIRRPHKEDMPDMPSRLTKLIEKSHLMRASHEDFAVMFGVDSGEAAYDLVKKRSDAVLVYTTGGEKVQLFAGDLSLTLPVPKISPVSTIGAGDTFNAGLLSALYKMKIGAADVTSLDKKDWIRILENGIRLAQMTCMSRENYIPV